MRKGKVDRTIRLAAWKHWDDRGKTDASMALGQQPERMGASHSKSRILTR
jgi:hypothetical protein